jgi:hypothetical protein
MNILDSLKERCFLIPRADFVPESQMELIKLIMKRHGEENLQTVKLIDENDDYDSFFIEADDLGICLKMSFDPIPIYYEHMVLKGIEELQLAPQVIDRNEIPYGQKIFYTLQSYEYSDNLNSIGNSAILDESFKDFNNKLSILHSYIPPEEVHEYLDDTKSFLEYQNINFDKIISYVDSGEEEVFKFIKEIYTETFSEMLNIFNDNEKKITSKRFVHGNLNSSTIINNLSKFKFINFENCFLGSPLFDLVNIIFELQMTGLKEHDFLSRRMKDSKLVENRLMAGSFIEEYKICKKIWIRKKFLDLIKEYVKEVIILNKQRTSKMAKLATNFSKHFYKFAGIPVFDRNKDLFVRTFSQLILDN